MTRRVGVLVGTGAAAVGLLVVTVAVLVHSHVTPAPEVPVSVPSTSVSVPACRGPDACSVRSLAGTPVQVLPRSQAAEAAFYQPPSPPPDRPPGTLLRLERLSSGVRLPPGARAWRMLYLSRTWSGAPTAVSGVVILPAGPSPSGGFPVLDYAHATTGLAAACAPSRFTTLEIPSLPSFIGSRDAVVATDYPGLGTPGSSSYVVGRSEGQSVLDADRAARQIPGARIGRRVVVLGYSQGGQAALFAGQLAPAYAPAVDLLGVVAEAPAVQLPQLLVHLMSVATFNGLVVTVAVAWSGAYPDLPITALLTPAATSLDPVTASGCETQIALAYHSLLPSAAFTGGALPTRPTTNPIWQELLEANSPGGSPLTAPTLVVTGSADTVLPTPLVSAYVDRACSIQHDPMAFDTFSGATHGTITTDAASTVSSFVAQRLSGRPWPHRCTRRSISAP